MQALEVIGVGGACGGGRELLLDQLRAVQVALIETLRGWPIGPASRGRCRDVIGLGLGLGLGSGVRLGVRLRIKVRLGVEAEDVR